MDIVITVTRDELTRLLGEFAPIRIHLTSQDEDRRWIELERPERVELVPGLGARIVTSGRLRYELIGISVPARIRELSVLLVPTITTAASGRQSLAFLLEVQKADLAHVPGLIDAALVSKVNGALTPESTHMIWHFGDALERRVALPERLEPLDALATSVSGGGVGVDDERISFTLRLALEVKRARPRPTDD
jgi:hypothetical protein